jgi:hypothetical protein
MGDDSTPIGSRQEASGDAERAPDDEDDAQRASPVDGARADGGPNHPEVVLPNVMGEGDVNAETKTAAGVVGEVAVEVEKNLGADQQVQHLSHFLFISVISYFFISQSFFTLPLHQIPQSSVGDSATQSSVPGDSFAIVINDIICSLEDDPTQKELHAEASQAKKRPTTIALENVSSSIAQQNVSTQPVTYVRRQKKSKQVCVCVVITISTIHFHSQSFIEIIHIIADFNKATG